LEFFFKKEFKYGHIVCLVELQLLNLASEVGFGVKLWSSLNCSTSVVYFVRAFHLASLLFWIELKLFSWLLDRWRRGAGVRAMPNRLVVYIQI
jgi:hypothetical protein